MKLKFAKAILITFNSLVFSFYGVMKLLGYQLSLELSSQKYEGVFVNDLKPVNLMWRFYAVSPLYAKAIGLAQLLSAVLILLPKTRKIGLILFLFQITQIIFINFCFDITIITKIISVVLLINTLFLIYIYRNTYKVLLN